MLTYGGEHTLGALVGVACFLSFFVGVNLVGETDLAGVTVTLGCCFFVGDLLLFSGDELFLGLTPLPLVFVGVAPFFFAGAGLSNN